MTTVYQRWEDPWQWWLLSLLCGSVWLFPLVLAAQPFDVEPLRHSVVRVLGNRGTNIGSGSLIKVERRTGYILTAHHVIQRDLDQGNASVKVELYTEQVLDARISRNRIDYANDIAVLIIDQLPAPPPRVIPWESATTIRDLQPVYALGHPSREIRWPITVGSVSGRQSGKIYFSGNAVHPGNSGGPLLNDQGIPVAMILTKEGEVFGTALAWDVIRPLIEGWVPGLSTPVVRQSTPPATSPSPPTTPPAPAATRRGQDGKEMLLVPEGWFTMGSTEAEISAADELQMKYWALTLEPAFADEKPQHRVWVDAFYMDKYEVTLGEYKAFLRVTGRQGLPESVSQYAPKETHPVVQVSWDDAEAYCRWAGKQLPTEAQWEKAARGSDGRRYPWGNDAVDGKRANYCDTRCASSWKDKSQDDGYQYTAPVSSYPLGKSPYGIEDLAGNVWEWVQDWYDAMYYSRSPERNPVNATPGTSRVLRGGGWGDNPANVRAAYRLEGRPASASAALAFGVSVRPCRPGGNSFTLLFFYPFPCRCFGVIAMRECPEHMTESDAPQPAPQVAQPPQLVSEFYEFMLWCMDRTQRFPRNYRGTLTRWIEDQLWDILDLLIEAAYTRHKLPLLEQSNLRLQKLRFLVRLCKDRQCLSLSQYEYAARAINTLGMALGGWIKQQHARRVP